MITPAAGIGPVTMAPLLPLIWSTSLSPGDISKGTGKWHLVAIGGIQYIDCKGDTIYCSVCVCARARVCVCVCVCVTKSVVYQYFVRKYHPNRKE